MLGCFALAIFPVDGIQQSVSAVAAKAGCDDLAFLQIFTQTSI